MESDRVASNASIVQGPEQFEPLEIGCIHKEARCMDDT